MHFFKRSVLFTGLLTSFSAIILSQQLPYASAVFEYKPAPGQHINDPLSGTTERAAFLTTTDNKSISLGAFGGYIILHFESAIENHPDNPYGVDFLIAGNAFTGSSEPGIVKVMKDVNMNGLPDDIWYELAGSRHFGSSIEKNYTIDYFNSDSNSDILWTDVQGDSGYVYRNSFHLQHYYPLQEFFPGYDQQSVSFNGNLLHIYPETDGGVVRTGSFMFGYADCNPVRRSESISLPDNPYTPGIIEGYGGDAFDISWAVDDEGSYVDLDVVNFIMIYSASNANAGVLGEISTEISAVADIPPAPGLSGPVKIISLENIQDYITAGSQSILDGIYFDKGRPVSENIGYSVNSDIVELSGQNLLAKQGGIFTLTAWLISDPGITNSKEIKIIEPSGIDVNMKFSNLPVGVIGQIETAILDQDGKKIPSAFPFGEIEDTTIALILQESHGRFTIHGLKKGKTTINLTYPGLDNAIEEIDVVSNLPAVEFSMAVKMGQQNIIPRRWYSTGSTDFNPYIDRAVFDIENPTSYICLAEVLTSVFIENSFGSGGNTFRFRADKYGGNKLYLWQIGKDWEFWYGWGGYNEESEYGSCWAVSLNDSIYFTDFNNVEVKQGDQITVLMLPDQENEIQNLVLHTGSNSNFQEKVFYELFIYDFDEFDRIYTREKTIPADQGVIFDGDQGGWLTSLSVEGSNYFLTNEFATAQKIWLENYPEEILMLPKANSSTGTKNMDLLIYPVPFREDLHLAFSEEFYGSLIIYDIHGRVLISLTAHGERDFLLNLSSQYKGIYFLKISGSKNLNRIIIKD